MRLRCKVTVREEPSQEKNIGVSTSGTNLTFPAFEYLIKEVCLFVLIYIIVTVNLHVKLNFRAHQVAYSRIYGEINQQTNKQNFFCAKVSVLCCCNSRMHRSIHTDRLSALQRQSFILASSNPNPVLS